MQKKIYASHFTQLYLKKQFPRGNCYRFTNWKKNKFQCDFNFTSLHYIIQENQESIYAKRKKYYHKTFLHIQLYKSLHTALKLFLISIPLKTFQHISEFIYEVAHFLELFISQRSVKHLLSIPLHASIYYNKNPIYLPGNVFVEDEFMKSRGIKAVLDSNADSSIFIMLLLSLYQLNPNSDQQIMAYATNCLQTQKRLGWFVPFP